MITSIILADGYWQELWLRIGAIRGLVISVLGIAGLIICFCYFISGLEMYLTAKESEIKDRYKSRGK